MQMGCARNCCYDCQTTQAQLAAPPGTYAHAWQSAQSQLEQRHGYVLLNEDFLSDSEVLSSEAREHLLMSVSRNRPLGTLLIERSQDPSLDDNRSVTVSNLLAGVHPDLAGNVRVDFVGEESLNSDQLERLLTADQLAVQPQLSQSR